MDEVFKNLFIVFAAMATLGAFVAGFSFLESTALGTEPGLVLNAATTTPCGISDYAVEPSLRALNGKLIGSVTVTNTSTNICILPDIPKLVFTNGEEILPLNTDLKNAVPGVILLEPGQSFTLPFVWQDWCKTYFGRSVFLSIRLDARNRIETGFSPEVVRGSRNPECAGLSGGSEVTVGPFFYQKKL